MADLARIAGGILLGCAVSGAVWVGSVKPRIEAAQKRYDTTMALWTLYDLQLANKKATRAYANSLDALLASAKNGSALKARMAASLDLNTVAVVGDAEKFKLEANVLDPERTLIKIKGPIAGRTWSSAPALPLPEAPSSSDIGAPIAR